MEVPLAITAFTAEKLKSMGIPMKLISFRMMKWCILDEALKRNLLNGLHNQVEEKEDDEEDEF